MPFILQQASSAYAFPRLNKNKSGTSGAMPRVETLFNISAFDGMYVECIISNSGILVSANFIAATLSSSSSTMNSQRFGVVIAGSSFSPTQWRNGSIAVVVSHAFTLGIDLQSNTEKFNTLFVYTKLVLLSREQFTMSTPQTWTPPRGLKVLYFSFKNYVSMECTSGNWACMSVMRLLHASF